MVLPKSKNKVGLGKAIIRQRFQNNTRPRDHDTILVHTTDMDDGSEYRGLQSITQEGDLEEFLHTATLAGTDFTAEKMNVQVVTSTYKNPFLLSKEEEIEMMKKQQDNKDRLTVPRRPKWERDMSAQTIQRNENEAFLNWRRELAMLQEVNGLLLTPYERNLEVWRQLWRVIERSQLVVQIVDARNPVFFRSPDLDKYIKEVDPSKNVLLLVNKADMLTYSQRKAWRDYFDSIDVDFVFFSAALATKKQEELKAQLELEEFNKQNMESLIAKAKALGLDPQQANSLDSSTIKKETDGSDEELDEIPTHDVKRPAPYHQFKKEAVVEEKEDPRLEILDCPQLLDLFQKKGGDPIPIDPTRKTPNQYEGKLTVGLVGYPNVGKSSTVNALIGSKKVAVAATPGKTKHFQTLHLDEHIILCDCPGLVFPSFASTQADMVCNGVLPIDQLREHTGPVTLITQRIPQYVLERLYGITIPIKPLDEGGSGIPTAEEFLKAYATSRGYTKSSEGNPDEARAARFILKDLVKGKLNFNHPPPDFVIEGDSLGTERNLKFNEEIYDIEKLPKRKMHVVPPTSQPAIEINTSKGDKVDNKFFSNKFDQVKMSGKFNDLGNFSRVQLYPHQQVVSNDGLPVQTNRLSNAKGKDKQHKKGKRHVKQRSGKGLD